MLTAKKSMTNLQLYLLILTPVFTLFGGAIVGYLVGRYQVQMLDKIHELEGKVPEPAPEPQKPVVVGGAYQAPKAISNVPEPSKRAGLVEAKTPEQMDWDSKQEIEALGTDT